MELLPEDKQKALRENIPRKILESRDFQMLVRSESDFVDKLLEGLLKRHPRSHVLATPLVELISIIILKDPDQDNGMPIELYGSIQIVDGEGAKFTVYNRSVGAPQTVDNGGTLMLDLPKGRAITPSGKVTVDIALMDRAHKDGAGNDVEMVVESYSWDFETYDECDIIQTQKVNGANATASVQYIVYKHAVFVNFEVILLKGKEDQCSNSADVHGSIVANYGNKCLTSLFDKKQSESIRVGYGSSIELSRAMVVLPAWSSLLIHAKLWNNDTQQQIVDNVHEFITIYNGGYSQIIEGQNGHIEVRGDWMHAYMQPAVPRSVEKTSNAKNIQELFPVAKKQWVTHQQSTSIIRNLFSDLRKSLEVTDPLMEVLSVSVHGNDKELNIGGSITVEYQIVNGPSFLFNKRETSPERLLRNQTVPLTFPTECMAAVTFEVFLDLKDGDGRVISYGNIYWYERTLKYPISWYDRKLCSIVPGDNGCYTAVHYSIFNGGLQALVNIHLISKRNAMKYCKVEGYVRSQYSKFEYLTQYDKDYYRRKLFEGHIEDSSLQLSEKDSKILLSKSCIAVPIGSTLSIDMNLKVLSDTMDFPGDAKTNDLLKTAECFEGEMIFSTERKIEELETEKNLHKIVISVEWSKVHMYKDLEDQRRRAGGST